MKSLIVMEDAEVLMTGVFPSLPANQLALWKDCENVLFFDSRVSEVAAQSEEVILGGTVNAIAQAYVEGENRIYAGQANGRVSLFNGVAQTSLGTGFTAGEWSLEVFGSWLLATNNENPLKVWKNTGSLVDLAGVNFTSAKIVKKLENHIVVFNTSIDEQEVRWSSKSNPELWEPATTNSAGGFPVRDLDSQIICAEKFGDALGFYSSNSFGIVQYIGSPFWFSVKKVLDGIGALSKDSVVAVNNEHVGLGPNGFFRNNGASFQYIDTPAIKRWFTSMFDQTKKDTVRAAHYQTKTMVVWFFECKDGLRRGLGYNYANQAWTIFRANITAVDEPVISSPNFPEGKLVIGSGASLGFFDVDNPPFTESILTPLPMSLRTASLFLNEPNRWKLWDRLRVDWTAGGEVRFGFGEKPDVVQYWTAWQPLAVDNWIGQESIYLTIEFRNIAVGTRLEISGMEIFGEITGSDR